MATSWIWFRKVLSTPSAGKDIAIKKKKEKKENKEKSKGKGVREKERKREGKK